MIWDFSTIMVLLVAASGLIWGVDAWLLKPRRVAAAGDAEVGEPVLVDYARSFFPIFLIVLLLRAFLVEPFRIPSGSMIPTLLVGDFILVNKFDYGIRLPVINRKIVEIGDPARGDVVVFRYPEDPSTPFIKRVVGLPGDHIAYRGKRLFINGEPVTYDPAGSFVGVKSAVMHTGAEKLVERIGDGGHDIIVTPRAYSFDWEGKVPADSYFVLGDNRDNSRDSRFWGFVPNENLIGRAFIIWMNWDKGPDLKRIGTSIE
jgi:signal peptidase I